jgi:hypothetical protein
MFLHGLFIFDSLSLVLVIVMYTPTCRFVVHVQSICIIAWWDRVVKLVPILDRIYSCDVPDCFLFFFYWLDQCFAAIEIWELKESPYNPCFLKRLWFEIKSVREIIFFNIVVISNLHSWSDFIVIYWTSQLTWIYTFWCHMLEAILFQLTTVGGAWLPVSFIEREQYLQDWRGEWTKGAQGAAWRHYIDFRSSFIL